MSIDTIIIRRRLW